MKSRFLTGAFKAFAAISFILAAALLYQSDSLGQAARKNKIYISTIKATGVPARLAARVKDRLRLTIFERYGTQYYVLDDDAIRVMYKQAEKILASGCDDVSCITQIADGINTDEIIYGEVKREGDRIAILMNNLVRDKATLQIGTKSIVTLSFKEEFLDHFVGEAAKKLMDPRYTVSTRVSPVEAPRPEGLDIAVLRFTSPDENIQPIIAYLKDFVEQGDKAYNKGDYAGAYRIYSDVIVKVNTKVTKAKRVKLADYIAGIVKRQDMSISMIAADLERKGDASYGEYRFEDALGHYAASLAETEKVTDPAGKRAVIPRLEGKIRTVKVTGENYLINQVKSLLDQCEYLNLKEKTADAKRLMAQARKLLFESSFTTDKVVAPYNEAAQILGLDEIPVNYAQDVKEVRIGTLTFVEVPAGEFDMGSPTESVVDFFDNEPKHRVRVGFFLMGMHEVTQAQYREVTGSNPSRNVGDDLPVENVSWDDAVAFCRQFGQKYGVSARLPTEAEWEYACGSGMGKIYFWGVDADKMGEYCWYDHNSGNRTHPVGRKRPNRWKLYDILGNVGEWCMDWYGFGYYSKSPGENPMGPESGTERVIRGGNCNSRKGSIGSRLRFSAGPKGKFSSLGLRVVVSPR